MRACVHKRACIRKRSAGEGGGDKVVAACFWYQCRLAGAMPSSSHHFNHRHALIHALFFFRGLVGGR